MPPRILRHSLLLTSLLCPGVVAVAQTQPSGPVDINHATAAEIARVPGLPAVWAQRIVRFRPYRTKADLVEKGIVPAEVYARIRDGIVARKNE
jgi:DNA uptake protein ComE-like DNA-binding protein